MLQMAGTVSSIKTKKPGRPPKRSVHAPSGRRTKEPVKIGRAVKKPNCVAVSPSSSAIGTPISPNTVQTMKQTVNANVFAVSTEAARNLSGTIWNSSLWRPYEDDAVLEMRDD